ncbi:MAG: hypothetical protein K9H49_14880 [Bacteroidales bacterium]|nr:hypothetical protein [Bacteroidales bacterium]MCF8390626.1 hypothetical protein [Bacteroidales bacterium]
MSDSIEILLIGASDAHTGLNPDYIMGISFNAAHPAQSLDYCFELLKKYENKWSKLESIVLTVSYPSLFYKMDKSASSWRVKNYRIYYNIKLSNKFKSHAEILNGLLFDQIKRIIDYYVNKNDEIYCNDRGWHISSDNKSLGNLEVLGSETAKRLTVPKEQQYYTELKTALDSIVNFSKTNKCSLLILTPPAYKSYRENFDKLQYDSTINTILRVTTQNNNCKYINLLEDNRFKAIDFLDGDHLNGGGAKKLSLIIDSILNN